MYSTNATCRDCGTPNPIPFLDLSDQPPANAFLKKGQIDTERAYPLRAHVCGNCQLVQLIDVVDLDELFQNYPYLTGVMPTTPKHFGDYARDVIARFLPAEKSFIVELGSNDGLLLRAFQEAGRTNVLGVDPAKSVAEIAKSRGVPTLAEPWSERVAADIAKTRGKADAIIGNNVVAHINDHQDLVRGVKALLAPGGVFIFEAPYLVDMFENLSFDTIYHEHLSCLSLRPLIGLFKSYGLEVFDVETKNVQGLSLRTYVGFPDAHPVSSRVGALIEKEFAMGLDRVESYHRLAERVAGRKDELVALLGTLKKEGKRIAGYGAPAKGNTLLNYMKIGPETLDYLTEELPTKIGLLSPGMHIPVVSIADARANPPDYFLLLAWNYADTIINQKEKALRDKGVKFIVPVGPKLLVL